MSAYEVHVTVAVHVEADTASDAADMASDLCSGVNNSNLWWVTHVFNGDTGNEVGGW